MGSLRSGEVNARLGVHATDGTACRVVVIAAGPGGQEISDLIEAGDSQFACEVVSPDEGPGVISDGSHDAYVLAHAADAPVSELLAHLVSSGPGPVVVLTDSDDRDADLMALEAGASGYLAKDRLDAETLQRTLRYAVATWGARRRTEDILSRSLLEAVSVPIAVLAASGEIVSSNPSWGAGTDRATHRYLPKSVALEAESDTLRELTTGVDAVLAGEEARFVLEYAHETSDEERWTRVVAIPVADGGAILCYWDITDERFARLALEETIRAKDEFITSISHELRTPLSVVVGLSQTLRIGAQDPSEMSEFHDLIADQAQEMAMIVEDLLVAGRIDSQTLTVRATMVDLPDEIDAVLRPWGRSEELELGVRLRPGAEKVYADSLRVRQILRNLVTNAGRYGKPPIEIKAVRARDRVILSVSDQGQGVPENALDRMFQPYARFGAVEGQLSSVGLGLHVARRLARLMGGDLVYKREAGLTTFLLSLPAESPDDSGRISNGLHLVMD